jgi:hypothetical protein
MPGCSFSPGYSFSIEDALIATRWAEQILSRGYRVVITPWHEDAEEVIEIYIPNARTPTSRLHRTSKAILMTDCIGLTLPFPTLADALLAMVPLSKIGEREMLKGGRPAWLPTFSPDAPNKTEGLWSRAGKSALEIARHWALRCILL